MHRPHGRGRLRSRPPTARRRKKEPLNVAVRPTGAHIFAAEYFAEEVRRYIFEKYGEKKLYEGGLSVRTTLDPKLQVLARKTMIDGLVNFDETQGWRGPVDQDRHRRRLGRQARRRASRCRDIEPWQLAVVLEVERSVGAHRPAAGARSRRRRGQGPRSRHRAARRREMGEAGRAGRRSRSSASARCSRRATSSMSSRRRRTRASSGCARCRRSPAPWW